MINNILDINGTKVHDTHGQVLELCTVEEATRILDCSGIELNQGYVDMFAEMLEPEPLLDRCAVVHLAIQATGIARSHLEYFGEAVYELSCGIYLTYRDGGRFIELVKLDKAADISGLYEEDIAGLIDEEAVNGWKDYKYGDILVDRTSLVEHMWLNRPFC